MRVALVLAILISCTAARAADGLAFLAACRTTAKDPHVAQGSVFAFVHEVGESSTTLYEVSGPRVTTLAWLNGQDAFEADGAMRASARASDVVAYLRRQPFRLVGEWKAWLASPGAALPACAIEYRVLGGYEKRH